ncbi:MAG: ferritin family protein [Chloroflexota bacterium]
MKQDNKLALAILEQGMTIESEGRQFYLKAAETTANKEGREMFDTLANDEQKHYNIIKRQYGALFSEGKWIKSTDIKPINLNLEKPLFPKGRIALEKTIAIKFSEKDALLFGLDIEMKSHELYRNAALKTGDPLGKQMFEFLTGQEQTHFDLLMMRYDLLFGPISWSNY